MKTIQITVFLMLIAFVTACAGPNPYGASSQQYSQSEANRALQVEHGVIIDLRAVSIDSEGNLVGKMAGGLIGGLAGSSVGGGKGSAIAAVAGAVMGGMIGNKAEAAINKDNGVQITVQLDNGRVEAVVQEVSPNVFFSKGDQVKLISDASGKMRVVQ